MADVNMPESVPCKFDNNWAGKCGKPSTNGWCSAHENKTCVSCGGKAIRACDVGSSLICGAPLCENCAHSPNGGGHVARAIAEEIYRKEAEEREADLTSRKSPVQRMNDVLGVPLNLHELLKGDTSEWPIKEFYFLELQHGLMGFFPAILESEKRVVIAIDHDVILRVLTMLTPRRSKLVTNRGYVNERLGILYPILGDNALLQEDSKPQKFVAVSEFNSLTSNGANPFIWAPGLVGTDMTTKDFRETLEALAKEHGVDLSATR